MHRFSIVLMAALFVPLISGAEYLAYVGTYTGKQSKGIYAFRFDPTHAAGLKPLGLAVETVNPSYLAVHPNRKFLYAVNEASDSNGEKSGAVSAFAIEPKNGKLSFLNQVSSRGADPCHLVVDPAGKNVLVANYSGGSIAVFPLKPDGRLSEASTFIQHAGASPHAHWIDLSPDHRFAIVADLGLDHLFVYHFDGAKGTLTPNDPPFTQIAAGSGPRHFTFHPNGRFGYLINELRSTVTALAYDGDHGTFRELQTVSTLPPDFKGENSTAEIQIDKSGHFLYGSNRGHDSIAVFKIDSTSGKLTPQERVSIQVKTPRYFGIDPTGAYLFAAGQDSDKIVVFRVDQRTGGLTPTGVTLDVPAPVCIKFIAP